MKSKWMIGVTALFILFFFCGKGETQTQNDLKRLRAQIASEEKTLKKLAGSKTSTVKTIQALQKKQADERRALNAINRQIAENTVQLKKLQAEETQLQKKQAQYIRNAQKGAMFLVDNSDSALAKAIFSDVTSGETAKMVELVNGLNANLNVRVLMFVEAAARLNTLQKDIKQHSVRLAEDKSESETLAESYAASQKKLDTALILIKQDEAAQKEYLSMLKLEQDRIDKALRQSKKAKKEQDGDFYRQKGALPFPIQGQVVEQYGEHVHEASGVTIMHKGIKIKPSAQGGVISVSNGTVVYVDHVNGMQNLIIIQHDKNYYTVYANIDEFYVNNRQQVEKGMEIGRINVDLNSDPSYLYFEIRNREKALDPLVWLKK